MLGLYHFDCPECGYNDIKARTLAEELEVFCTACVAETGEDVMLVRWPAFPGICRDEAKKLAQKLDT